MKKKTKQSVVLLPLPVIFIISASSDHVTPLMWKKVFPLQFCKIFPYGWKATSSCHKNILKLDFLYFNLNVSIMQTYFCTFSLLNFLVTVRVGLSYPELSCTEHNVLISPARPSVRVVFSRDERQVWQQPVRKWFRGNKFWGPSGSWEAPGPAVTAPVQLQVTLPLLLNSTSHTVSSCFPPANP